MNKTLRKETANPAIHMAKRNRPRITLGVLLVALASAPYAQERFAPQQALQSNYSAAERKPVILNAGERNYMLNEMRFLLDMLWVTADALSRDDFSTVARVARRRGFAMQPKRIPPEIDGKLPTDFRTALQDTYKMIDSLADVAESSNDWHPIIGQTARLLRRCNECHAAYQFRVE